MIINCKISKNFVSGWIVAVLEVFCSLIFQFSSIGICRMSQLIVQIKILKALLAM